MRTNGNTIAATGSCFDEEDIGMRLVCGDSPPVSQ
jgi:hypothetical protein